MRRQCQPLLIRDDGSARHLKRIPFTDRSIQEGKDLQALVHRAPELLPVEELDSSFAPLVSLGREVSTNAGRVDNLFMSPGGRITLVEAKLWRNPQATREVVAQVLDYAKVMKDWSYEDLEQAVRRADDSALSSGESLYTVVGETGSMSEAQFVDAVQRTLATGRFLLLVVGDGVRENIEEMIDVLHTRPDLLFTFGLVEMQFFEDAALGGRIVLPQVIARTSEVVRAVVKVQDGADRISVSLDRSLSETSSGRKRRLSEDEFFDSITDEESARIFRELVDAAAEVGAMPHPGTSYLQVKLADPAGGPQQFNLFSLAPDGTVSFGWFATQLENAGYPAAIAWDMFREVADLFEDIEVKDSESLSRNLSAVEVESRRDEFIQVVARAIQSVRREAQRFVE